MIFRSDGEVVPGFHVLGSWHTPSYLWDGPRPVLFDAGMAFLGSRYVEHALRVLGSRQPEYLLLTHVHFDHCGAASILRDAFPSLRIGSSHRASEILKRPRALELMRQLNEDSRQLEPLIGIEEPGGGEFRPFHVDTVLQDGDVIDLGEGQSVHVLATPGHTRDFLSYYLPHAKVLVASEAVGCANISGEVMVEFVADYDSYLGSLRRLLELEVEVLCQGHLYVYVGTDARAHLERSIRATGVYLAWVEQLLHEEHGDVERVVARVKAEEWEPALEPKQPASAYLLNTEARVRHIQVRRRE